MARLATSYLGRSPVNSKSFCLSHKSETRQKALLFIRIFNAMLLLIINVCSACTFEVPKMWFFYLSHLSSFSAHLYFILAAVVQLQWRRWRVTHNFAQIVPAAVLIEIEWLYACNVTYNLLIPIVYWVFLFRRKSLGWFATATNVAVHSVIPICMLAEAAQTQMHMRTVNSAVLATVLVLYVMYSWIGSYSFPYADGQPRWTYFFMDFHKPLNFVYILCIGLFAVGVFFVFRLLHIWRRRKSSSNLNQDFGLSPGSC